MRTFTIAIGVSLLCSPVMGQWLKQPTSGIPRSADGRPNLAAPTPRTVDGKPDLSGLWSIREGVAYLLNIAADLQPNEVLPWAAALFTERLEEFGKDDPGNIGCLPVGPRYITGIGQTRFVKIVQTPAVIVVLFEDLAYRQIFMDGRELPKDPNPSFMGYSVGRWDGDDLVIESIGFNDRTWLDAGHPHTESLRITERYRRRDFGHIQRQVTVDDPKTFTKTITIASEMVLAADTELIEYVCAENPKSQAHLVGRTSEERNIKAAPETLAKYVGVYEAEGERIFGAVQRLDISLFDGKLQVDLDGKGRLPLVPLSETMFSWVGGTYEFVMDGQGVVTHLLTRGTGNVVRAVRKNPGSIGK